MSGQGPPAAHKVRRNVSPSQTQRQGPMKAVMPFILKHSPSRSPSSPTLSSLAVLQRRSPVADRLSPDSRRSPSSPGSYKVERPKPVRVSPASSSLRRTGSLDTIGPYLKGQWPVDIGGYHHNQQSGTFMLDKTTQTCDEDFCRLHDFRDVSLSKSEKKKKKHRRSASFGHADKKLGPTVSIRQKLQKTMKEQGGKQRSSPVPGNHNALLQTAPAVLMRSVNIPIATLNPKTPMSRFQRNSVEGLNPEVDKLLALHISGPDEESERDIYIPDGHRAPVPDMSRTSSGTRSVDTQTPSGTLDGGGRSSESPASPASRPHSISPAIPIMPGHLDNSPRPGLLDNSPRPGHQENSPRPGHLENSPRPASSNYDSLGSTPRDKSDKDTGDSDSISPEVYTKKSASPQPNKIVREPPDGCEKITVYDEDKSGKAPSIKEPLLSRPVQSQFVLKQSDCSAFCPLKKIYTSQGTNFTQTSPISTSILENQ